jgi:DNA replication and repair protein RecF
VTMFLSSIDIRQFRNFPECKQEFSKQVNFIVGDNAQGKTNFLEAIYLLCLLKSFRTHRDEEMVPFSGDPFTIAGVFNDEAGIANRLYIQYDRETGKQVYLNSKKIHQFSQIIGNFPAVVFSAHDFEIIHGSPIVRRRLFNIILAQCSRRYLYGLKEYEDVLKQRNRMLLTLAEKRLSRSDELDVWDQQLVRAAIPVMQARIQFVTKLNRMVEETYRHFDAEGGRFQIEYAANISAGAGEDASGLFQNILEQNRRLDIQRASSQRGPHRDDFLFKLDGRPLKNFGSRGEHKSALVCLKAAECRLLHEQLSVMPLILLDDIFSELDERRGQKAFSLYGRLGQCFISGTRVESVYGMAGGEFQRKYFCVRQGTVEEIAKDE